jgi:hypothetical protein
MYNLKINKKSKETLDYLLKTNSPDLKLIISNLDELAKN